MTLLHHEQEKKQCYKCGNLRLLTEFYWTKKDYRKSSSIKVRRNICKACQDRESKKRNKEQYYIYYMLYSARVRAEKKGLAFDLVVSDITIPEICPLLGIPIYKGDKYNKANSPSLDRIDNTKGYIKGNAWIISNKANAMKHNATLDELKLFSTNILKLLSL